MKNHQILLEATLTAASGITGLSYAQENFCSPAADCPPISYLDVAMAGKPVAVKLITDEEDRKWMKKKWGSRYATPESVHLETELLPLMEMAFEEQNFGACVGTIPTLRFRDADGERLQEIRLFVKKDNSVSRCCETQMQDPKTVQLESVSVEKLKDQYAFILVPHTACGSSTNSPIVVPLTKTQHPTLAKFAEKFWLAMNPSESFSPYNKKIVQVLLSSEKEQCAHKGFVMEMPDVVLFQEIHILKSCIESGKTDREGVYFPKKYRASFSKGSDSLCDFPVAKVIRTPTLSILNLKSSYLKSFVFAAPIGKNPKFDKFVEEYGIYLQSEGEMEKFLDSENSESSDSGISSMDYDSDWESDSSIPELPTILPSTTSRKTSDLRPTLVVSPRQNIEPLGQEFELSGQNVKEGKKQETKTDIAPSKRASLALWFSALLLAAQSQYYKFISYQLL
eukprot:GHVP01049689.1.p1 GENE.GHVP01049689.1~~GHVP01049689.1.p1  ORF type:complete len:452 (+),score=84.13 GHVP01049689.1:209-1564(+)